MPANYFQPKFGRREILRSMLAGSLLMPGVLSELTGCG